MKKNIIRFAFSAVVTAAVIALPSCVSETPFSGSGDGILRLRTSINGDVTVSTRATGNPAQYDQANLENNLVVYIERSNDEGGGLIRKFKGKSSIPPTIALESGNYVVEAWTGDSCSASFDKKFYRCYTPVAIKADEENPLALKCNIANVIVSVDEVSLNAGISDLSIDFFHSRKGTKEDPNEYVLTFNETNIRTGAKAYFMMPNEVDASGKVLPAKETVINYVMTGKKSDGSDFRKVGVLENVVAAHQYNVKVVADQSSSTTGGALVRLEIQDIDVIEETAYVLPAPEYRATYGSDNSVEIDKQINLTDESGVKDFTLTVSAFKGISNLSLTFSDNFAGMEAVNGANLVGANDVINALGGKGISYSRQQLSKNIPEDSDNSVQIDEVTIVFSKAFLETLNSEKEHLVKINATDGRGFSSSTEISFASTDAAIRREAPVGTPDPTKNENIDYTSGSPYSAVLAGEVYSDEAVNYGIKYRESGSAGDWTEISATSTRAGVSRFTVKATGLKPGTTYEYKAYCDGFEEETARTFTTETVFTIPNASMEEWSKFGSKNIIFPGSDGVKSFWDTGNEGANMAGAVLTTGSSDMIHSGEKAAKLESKFASVFGIGKLAAGNIFVGTYDKTSGTNGELTFGRPYDGSHPSKLRVWANYRPGKVDQVKQTTDPVPSGFGDGDDYGQIYVALTTEAVKVKTADTNTLFNPEADYIIAYGEQTWTGNFGADGQLSEVNIPLKYKDKAKTVKPTYLVIVCSASKYGDYFTGSSSSVMYVDDFELIYE